MLKRKIRAKLTAPNGAKFLQMAKNPLKGRTLAFLPNFVRLMSHPDYRLYPVHDRIAIKETLRNIDIKFYLSTYHSLKNFQNET